ADVNTPGGNLGFFNFLVDGVQKATNIACGVTTSTITVAPGVQHTVTETAGTSTDLNDFTTTYGDDCASNGTVTVASGATKNCNVTNTVNTAIPARCSADGFTSADTVIVGTVNNDTINGANSHDLVI